MNSLVILGAADGSVSTYQRAAKLGYRTIAVDVRLSAPALEYADEYLQISVRAPELIAAALLERDDIVGVLCPASDVGLPSLHWLARHWNLPDPLPEAAVRASVDKAEFRDICRRLGLPNYHSVAGEPGPELVAAAQQLRYPALVKPVDSSGSRGVVSCAGPGRLTAAFAESVSFSPTRRLVVEEFLDGEHFTVEVLVVDGEVAFHAVTERTITPPPYFVTASHLLPAQLPPSAEEQLVTSLHAVCAELGYRNGPLTLDAVLTRDDQLHLIEMGARMGGNGLAELIESCYGVDLIGASIALAVGERPELEPTEPAPTLVHMLTSDRAGHLASVEGIDEVKAIPEVTELRVFAEPGDYVHAYEQAGYKLGYVVLAGESPHRLREAESEVRERLRFVLVEQDMVVPLP